MGNKTILLAGSLALCAVANTGSLRAQIVPDSSLPVNSSVTASGSTKVISGGTAAGANLFHSFSQFSLPTGTTAHFNSAPHIQNIITRITGTSISNIDGQLKANGTANLFLLNPNGIIFGPSASLNIGGSFLATTASAVKFAGGGTYSATPAQDKPLLEISVPIGLQFAGNQGIIIVRGAGNNISFDPQTYTTIRESRPAGLAVSAGQTLALLGGEIALYGGNLTAPGGQIALASAAGAGDVSLNPAEKGWNLGYSGVSNFQDIRLENAASLDASGEGGGNIEVRGSRVSLAGGSAILALTLGSEPGGTVAVSAPESVELAGTSPGSLFASGLYAETQGAGAAGNIAIDTGRLRVRGGGQVSAGSFSSAPAGNITVKASQAVELTGTSAGEELLSGLFSETHGAGAGGKIEIATGQLRVRDGAVVSLVSFSGSQGGSVAVSARSVELTGTGAGGRPSGLFATNEGTGAAGNVTVAAQELRVEGGAQVAAVTYGAGQGGDLTVTAEEVEVLGTTAGGLPSSLTSATYGGTGAAGNVTIAAQTLRVWDGAQVSTATYGQGRGGDLTVRASRTAELSGTTPDGQYPSGLFAQTLGAGNAGNLKLSTGSLSVRNGAQIGAGAGTGSSGQGGALDVSATDSVELAGKSPAGNFSSGLFARSRGAGNAGKLTLTTGTLTLRDGALVTVGATAGSANAGDLEVRANSILLDSNSSITAATASGEGGNITLLLQDSLQLRRNSSVTATAGTLGGWGNGGNITVSTGVLAALENSDITANAYRGNGGNIKITTSGIFLSPDSHISASSQYGLSGVVEITTPDADPSQGLLAEPVAPLDASRLIAQSCPADTGSTFTVTGRGGLPVSPNEALSDSPVWEDWRTAALTERPTGDRTSQIPESPNPGPNPGPTPLVEATSWVSGPNGQVILTASALTATPHSPWLTSPSCQASP